MFSSTPINICIVLYWEILTGQYFSDKITFKLLTIRLERVIEWKYTIEYTVTIEYNNIDLLEISRE